MSELSQEAALSTSLLSHLARGQARPKIAVSTRPGHQHQEQILKIVPPATLGQPPSWRHAGGHTSGDPHDFLYLPLSTSYITLSASHNVCERFSSSLSTTWNAMGNSPSGILVFWLLWQVGPMEREVGLPFLHALHNPETNIPHRIAKHLRNVDSVELTQSVYAGDVFHCCPFFVLPFFIFPLLSVFFSVLSSSLSPFL